MDDERKYTFDLRALVIEDEAPSRRFMRDELNRVGFRHVSAEKNGSTLLKQHLPIEAEVILMGVDLGHAQGGVELVRQLQRQRLLLPWVKVIFVTSMVQKVMDNLPMLQLRCDVHPKPFNTMALRKQIMNAAKSVHYFRSIMVDMETSNKRQVLAKISSTPIGGLALYQRQDAIWIRAQLMLRVNRPDLGLQLLDKIKSPALRFQGQLHNHFLYHKTQDLKLAMVEANESKVLQSTLIYYRMYLEIAMDDDERALELLDSFDVRTLSTFEIDLKSQLLLLTKGRAAAVDFLMRKLGISIENLYFRNAVTLTLAKVYFLDLFLNKANDDESKDTAEAVQSLMSANSLSGDSGNFERYIPLIPLMFESLNGIDDGNRELFVGKVVELEKEWPNPDSIQLLILAMIFAQVDMLALASEKLMAVETVLAKMEMCPEYLIHCQLSRLIQHRYFDDKAQYEQLNRFAEHMRDNDLPSAAMGHFFRAHMLNPKRATPAIGLYKLMVQGNIAKYQGITQGELEARLANMKLSSDDMEAMRS